VVLHPRYVIGIYLKFFLNPGCGESMLRIGSPTSTAAPNASHAFLHA
jgi:hypothetical protein